MKIHFYGHAAVGLFCKGGTRILLDPYKSGSFGGSFRYSPIPGRFDIVVVSHEHDDHNYVAPSFGTPTVVKAPMTCKGFDFRVFTGRHGDNFGTVKADTNITMFTADDMQVVHPGDLGGTIPDSLIANLKGPDILFVPVGGRFTLDPKQALDFVRRINPKVAIPMHFKTPAVDFPIQPLEDFVALADKVKSFSTSEVEVSPGTLPNRTEIWTLPPSQK
jgi:L-ascorbate metabolism protein UlaG (beta-lactamase superfamily)